MKYAKLIEGEIYFAPKKIKNGNSITYNPPSEMLTELGYKPVTFTEPPQTEEGYQAVSTWTDKGEYILQEWEIVQAEPSAEDIINILLGGES